MIWLFEAVCVTYLLILLLCAIFQKCRKAPNAPSASRLKFCIVVPAHNEELLIGSVVDGLLKQNYPTKLYNVVVIADNCTDETAAIGRAHKAEVLERSDLDRPGKGWALDWALAKLLNNPRKFDAFVMVDADSHLSADFLQVMVRELDLGHKVIQGYYTVLNTDESWRTKLMTIALAMAHYVKPMGRNFLGFSDGLKGNGMCFCREAMEKVPWSGESITEDIEHTLRLVQAGIRIQFAPDAVVTAQMPVDSKQAVTQRQRWEGGRYALLKRAIVGFTKAIIRRKWCRADRSFELIIPPFAEMIAVPIVMSMLAVLARWMFPSSTLSMLWLKAWVALMAGMAIYLAGGLALARVPFRVTSSLLFAPAYIVWKLGVYVLMIAKRGTGEWVRTERRTLK